MANQKNKKQVLGLIKKHFDKSFVSQLIQKPFDYSRLFLPFIIIITAIVLANTLGNDFINNWDDDVYILDNEIIRNLNWNNLKEIFSFSYGSMHPLTILSYTIEYKLFGLNPFPFHLTNYIFHILNAVLVYLFLNRLTGKPWVAAITALFFAVHPMHVEAVAWISERKSLLYTFFFLLSLNSYSKYLVTKKKFSYLLWSFLWFFCSLMSKPAAVCLPFVLVLMDYYHYKKLSWKLLISKIPFFFLALLFGILIFYFEKSPETIAVLNRIFSIPERVLLVSYSTIYYIFKVFAPFNLSALHFYPVKSDVLPIEYYLALPALLLLIWGVIKSGSFKHEIIFGLLFYLITIASVLQIMPIGQAIVSERYSYIPYIGVFFIFGQFFSYIKDKKFSFNGRIKFIVYIVLVILTVLYSFLTIERNKVWKNGIVLFTDVIEKYPEHEFGWFARGKSKDILGDFNGALSDNNKAIEINPQYANAYSNRGIVYAKIGKYDNAIADFNKVIELKPKYAEVYANRGNVYSKIGNYDSAIADYNIAIKIKPDFPEVLNNRGIYLINLNRIDESLRDFNKAIELNPQFTEAYFTRGSAYAKIGKYDNAIADFNKAIELNPQYANAFFNRGIVKFNLNDKTGACNDWLLAQQYGHEQAATTLEKYCK